MGNDAEYYIEQQEEEARFKQACDYAALDHRTWGFSLIFTERGRS